MCACKRRRNGSSPRKNSADLLAKVAQDGIHHTVVAIKDSIGPEFEFFFFELPIMMMFVVYNTTCSFAGGDVSPWMLGLA